MESIARKLYQRITNFGLAFMLAASSFAVVGPFLLSQSAGAAGTVHTTDLSTWDLSETRATGHNNLVANGLHVWTEGATSTDKAAGYFLTPGLDLSDVDATSINFDTYTGGRPSVQLVVDRDNNGTPDGILVHEPWAYPPGDTYWTNGVGFGVPAGLGYASNGTLVEYQDANPDAKILAIGYSLGSGVLGDAIISSIVIGDTTYTFGLIVDTQRPEVSFISPATEGEAFKGNLDVSFQASDNDLLHTVTVNIKDENNSGHIGSCGSDSNLNVANYTLNCTIDTTDFADGVYYLRAGATDVSGNNRTISSKVIFDNSNPTVSLSSPASNFISNGKLNITGTAADAVSGIDRVLIYVGKRTPANDFAGYAVNGATASWDGTNFSYEVTDLPEFDGTYYVRAVAFDAAGNQKFAGSDNIVVDTTAPYVEITNPTGTLYNADVEVRGTVDDDHPRHYWINVTRDGSTVFDQVILATSFTNQLLYTATSDGDYVVTLAARDAAGGTATSGNRSLDVVREFTIDTQKPTAPVIEHPINGQYFNTGNILNEWSASTDDSGILGYQIAYQYDDGHEFSLGGCDNTDLGIGDPLKFIGCRNLAGTQRTHLPTVDEQGGVTIWVRAQDKAGNWSDWSDSVHYTYDATAPTVSITSHADGEEVTGAIEIAGVANDNIDLSHYNLSIYPAGVDLGDGEAHGSDRINGLVGWGSGTVNNPGKDVIINKTLDTTLLSDGEYQIRLAARDKATNRDISGVTGSPYSVHVITLTVKNAPVVIGDYFSVKEEGLNVGFFTERIKNAESVSVALFDTDDNPITANVGDSADMLALLNSNPVGGISSPFYIPVTIDDDGYWQFGNPDWRTVAKPAYAIVTVTYDGGKTVQSGEILLADPGDQGHTYESLIAALPPIEVDEGEESTTPDEGNTTDPENDEGETETGDQGGEGTGAEEGTGGLTPPDNFIEEDETAVEGAQDENGDQDVAAAQDDNTTEGDENNGTLLGLAWYWWLAILAAIAAAWWLIAAALRRRNNEEA